jgi:hypothetical protein
VVVSDIVMSLSEGVMSSRIPLIRVVLLLEARPSVAVSLFEARPSEAFLVDCSLFPKDHVNVEVPPNGGCTTTGGPPIRGLIHCLKLSGQECIALLRTHLIEVVLPLGAHLLGARLVV